MRVNPLVDLNMVDREGKYMESITREGLALSVFDGVKEDPPESIVLQLIEFAKELKSRNSPLD